MNDALRDDAPASRPNRTVPVSVRPSTAMVAEIQAVAQRLVTHNETRVAGSLDQL
jgi:hypothetical protein